MKRFITIIFIIATTINVYSQEVDTIWVNTQYPPELIGTQLGLMKYLKEAVNTAPELIDNHKKGKVIVQFYIEKNGTISCAQEDKKRNQLHDPFLIKVACRIVTQMPFMFKPARNGNTPVRSIYYLPVIF